MEKGLLDGQQVIGITNEGEDRVSTFDIEANKVFALDVVVSADKEMGKNKYSEIRTSVFKRNQDVHTELKTKHSRALLNEIQ